MCVFVSFCFHICSVLHVINYMRMHSYGTDFVAHSAVHMMRSNYVMLLLVYQYLLCEFAQSSETWLDCHAEKMHRGCAHIWIGTSGDGITPRTVSASPLRN